MNHEEARNRVGFDADKKYVIWCSNPSRPEKNYALAQEAVKRVNSEERIVNSDVYDLNGRLVQNPAKGGVYIINNKKVVIKK